MDTMNDPALSILLRSVARATGLLLGGGYVFLVFMDLGAAGSRLPSNGMGWVTSLLFSGIFAGLLLARTWELPGAIVSLAAVAGFAYYSRIQFSPLLWVLTAPIFLYLLDWWLHRRPPQASAALVGETGQAPPVS